MISLMLKANFVSLIFLVFIFRFAFSNTKSEVLVRANTYFCFLFIAMYFLYLINLTSKSQVQEFPTGLKHYPLKDIEHKVS
jgi:membrane-associated HD superfamily phosphohydrolase